MRGLETDRVTSGPIRGLKKSMGNGHQTDKQTNKQTIRHVDSMTDPAQRAESVKKEMCNYRLFCQLIHCKSCNMLPQTFHM